MVLLRIEGEDFTWQQTVGLVLPIEHRNMRDNLAR